LLCGRILLASRRHAGVARIGLSRAIITQPSRGNLRCHEEPPDDSRANHFLRGRLCGLVPRRFSGRARANRAASRCRTCPRRCASGCRACRCISCRHVACPGGCAARRSSASAQLWVPATRLWLSTAGLWVPATRLWLSTADLWVPATRLRVSTALCASGRDGCIRLPYPRRILHASLAGRRRRISQ
jgi:hypothetical protein